MGVAAMNSSLATILADGVYIGGGVLVVILIVLVVVLLMRRGDERVSIGDSHRVS